MISENKFPKALKALHEVILKSRILAHAQVGEDGELFSMLDSAEYLIAVMMEEGDSTEAYREYLRLFLNETDCPGALAALRSFEVDSK